MGISTGAALLGSSALSAGASFLGGRSQSGAAGQAAPLQAEAMRESIAEQRRQFDLTRADFAPWRDTGVKALDRLSQMFLGTGGGATGQTREVTETTPGTATQEMVQYGNGLTMTMDQYRQMYPNTSVELNNQRIMDDDDEADYANYITRIPGQPGQQQTTTRTEQVPGGETAYPDYSEFYKSPGYQFRMDEGTRALDRSAAARGGLRGGGYGRELTRYAQGVASDEFNSYANRLSSMAGMGQTATGSTAQAGANAANSISNSLMSGAAAQGQFLQNAGTARASGFAGVANAASGAANNFTFLNALRSGGTPIG